MEQMLSHDSVLTSYWNFLSYLVDEFLVEHMLFDGRQLTSYWFFVFCFVASNGLVPMQWDAIFYIKTLIVIFQVLIFRFLNLSKESKFHTLD